MKKPLMFADKLWGPGRSLAFCLVATVSLMAALAAASGAVTLWLDGTGDRTQALGRIAGAVAAELVIVALALTWVRRQGVSALEQPWAESGRIRGWALAGVVWTVWSLPLILRPPAEIPLFEPSLFNLLGSILAGGGAGVMEEWLFRGLFFAVLARGGWGWLTQLLVTSLLFGLAHMGWAVAVDPYAALLPVAGTTVLGLLLGSVYLLAGRRLLPSLVLHAAIDVVIEPWLVLAAVTGTLTLPGA